MSTPDPEMEVGIPVEANSAYGGELAAASEAEMETETETETDMDSDAVAEENSTSWVYPSDEVTYDEIVQNAQLFSDKLKTFNSSFLSPNIKFSSSIEDELDLHRLFVEVTSRGGLEKVIKEHKWKEVASLFDVPSISSSSFLLRKCYISLLYHFEQCYYFRRSVSRIVPANACVGGLEVQHEVSNNGQSQANSGLPPGITVIGTIDDKCDNGYVVSVNVGDCGLMKGILYHIADMPAVSSFWNPPDTSLTVTQQEKRRRKYRLTSRDPLKPKPNRSGYTFFFEEQYAKLRPSYQGQERGISKKIGQLWTRLSETEKQVYQEKGLQDKERYQKQMMEYNLSHSR